MATTTTERRVQVTFNADGSQLNRVVTDLERTVERSGRTASQAGGVFGKFGADVKQGIAMGFGISTVSVVSGAINVLKDAVGEMVNIGMEFEQSMANVKAISGATGEEFEKLSAFARKLGADTWMSAQESADAMAFLAMAGWDTTEMMAGLPAILDLTVASGRDFAMVADIVSDNLTAFGLTANDATMYSDALAYAMANANVNMDTLGESLKYIAPVASTAGFSMQETVAAVMMLGDAGIKGSQAGTTLRTVMLNLTGANANATKKLKELGVQIYDSEGKTKSLTSIIRDLEKATEGMTDAQKAQTFNTIAGKTAVAGLSTMVQQGSDQLEEYTNGVKTSSGATKEMAETMGETTNGKMKVLESGLEELALVAYDTFKPAIDFAVEGVTSLIQAMNGTPTPIEQSIEAMTVFGQLMEGVSQTTLDAIKPFEQMQDELNNIMFAYESVGLYSADTMNKILESTQGFTEKSVHLMKQKQEEEWALITQYSQKYLSATEEEQAKLQEGFASFYEGKIAVTQDREKAIQDILAKASEEKRTLTAEENNTIKSMMDANMQDLIKIASNSQDDQLALLNAFKAEEIKITEANAKSILDQAKLTKDGVLQEAQKRLDGEIQSANALRKAGQISTDEYNGMVATATSSYEKIATDADKGFNEVKQAIIDSVVEAGGKYNEHTGKLRDSHGKLVADLKNNKPETEVKVKTKQAEDAVNAIQNKINNITGKTVEVKIKQKTVKSIGFDFGGGGRMASSLSTLPQISMLGMERAYPTNNTINYNGDIVLNNRNDIDYFMRQTARAIERKY